MGIYPRGNDSACDLSAFGAELRQYMELKTQIKTLEKMADESANRVKAFMGESGGGSCDGFRVSWKTQTRRIFDSKRFAQENPGIDLSDYYKQSEARVFRVSETN